MSLELPKDGPAALPHDVPSLCGRRKIIVVNSINALCDIFLGVPFNIASYSLLTHMLAQQCDLDVGDFVWTGGDCHIYNNHFDQVRLQLSREPRPYPKLVIKRRPDSNFRLQV